ncbi:conserved Plasmodium protein, unknown function [Plasmodium vivax]|uniref:LIMP protein n=5 Tax=Plasmodium vivax TaxID=5855 RepID=A5K0H3_PLAVS|nr:hypothetical protein, conserved [Plasmodium vivax]KMZ83607.1 hypothetical protein PVBG_00687 [Plasmodium vivax Brazil I]KMZ90983.1 hypothetical protein PVMG_05691 [Plasmodium vivax Mauritania I]KMZ97593.1 hypothetical protein PVNG_01330 [Plasmodium vivax North Korean]EDL46820.1 hypothetical protein, conserved [Plasmodium vivax]CAG9475448.1 unnamed protein product [Plasmodium vivax]|eukprot:XP_001616547.1 hypothetical protein [Plasmodium vivax Sal-1]
MMKRVVLLIFLFLLFAEISLTLRNENGETRPKDGMFVQIDRDMNEPPYSVINVYYTESLINEDLEKEIENNRKIEQNKMKNYFRKNLTGNKYFMDYSKKQREQMESLLDLSG